MGSRSRYTPSTSAQQIVTKNSSILPIIPMLFQLKSVCLFTCCSFFATVRLAPDSRVASPDVSCVIHSSHLRFRVATLPVVCATLAVQLHVCDSPQSKKAPYTSSNHHWSTHTWLSVVPSASSSRSVSEISCTDRSARSRSIWKYDKQNHKYEHNNTRLRSSRSDSRSSCSSRILSWKTDATIYYRSTLRYTYLESSQWAKIGNTHRSEWMIHHHTARRSQRGIHGIGTACRLVKWSGHFARCVWTTEVLSRTGEKGWLVRLVVSSSTEETTRQKWEWWGASSENNARAESVSTDGVHSSCWLNSSYAAIGMMVLARLVEPEIARAASARRSSRSYPSCCCSATAATACLQL